MLAGGLLLGLGVWLGQSSAHNSGEGVVPDALREQMAYAVGSANQSDLCLATGSIDRGIEGVFALDGVTGQLTCYAVDPKTPNVPAVQIVYNVLADLSVQGDKAPRFVMVTGATVPPGGGAKLASTVLYIGDANTGNTVAYMFQLGPAQKNVHVLGKFRARPAVLQQ